MEDYRAIAREIADDIAAGRLEPGDRLPPQRTFAYGRGIASSTAGRVYAELARRGLVNGERGRGTFVRASPLMPIPPLAQPPSRGTINLETNYPVLPDQQTLLAPLLRRIARNPELLQRTLRETNVRGTVPQRIAAASGLARQGWRPEPESLLFASNGKQAIGATFAAIAKPGDRIGFEPLTYPLAKALAERQGLVPVPLAVDDDGVRPDAIAAAHRAAPLRAVYLQPTMQNPIGTTMSASRRQAIAVVLEKADGPLAIEDAVYAFLDEHAPVPLCAFAPNRTILIESLSKRIGPGLTLGIIAAPRELVEPLSKAIIAGAWGASGFAMETGTHWLGDGTTAALEAAKRHDAHARQEIARREFAGCVLRAHPFSYHVLLDLPERRRAEQVVERAAAEGIAIAPAAAFTVTPGHAPNSVRIGLANLDLAVADTVLRLVAALVTASN